jgi:H+/Cl- antiporter ClcA
MNNRLALKVVAGILAAVNIGLIFAATLLSRAYELDPTDAGVGLFGGIIGGAIAIFLIQRIFEWILTKAKVKQPDLIALIIALIIYTIFFSLSKFNA